MARHNQEHRIRQRRGSALERRVKDVQSWKQELASRVKSPAEEKSVQNRRVADAKQSLMRAEEDVRNLKRKLNLAED